MRAITTVALAFSAGLAGAFVFNEIKEARSQKPGGETFKNVFNPASSETFSTPDVPMATGVDFSDAAARATPSVVYINSIAQSGVSYTYWDMLFGGGGSPYPGKQRIGRHLLDGWIHCDQ
ncbi:MAG: hypothetical protein WDO15_22500 [Bacteroidota bacterium]